MSAVDVEAFDLNRGFIRTISIFHGAEHRDKTFLASGGATLAIIELMELLIGFRILEWVVEAKVDHFAVVFGKNLIILFNLLLKLGI